MEKILCLTLILFGFTGIFAQEKNVTQAEFDTILKNALSGWKDKSYRMITTSETSSEWNLLRPMAEASIPSAFSSPTKLSSQSAREDSFNSNTLQPRRIGDPDYISTSKTITDICFTICLPPNFCSERSND